MRWISHPFFLFIARWAGRPLLHFFCWWFSNLLEIKFRTFEMGLIHLDPNRSRWSEICSTFRSKRHLKYIWNGGGNMEVCRWSLSPSRSYNVNKKIQVMFCMVVRLAIMSWSSTNGKMRRSYLKTVPSSIQTGHGYPWSRSMCTINPILNPELIVFSQHGMDLQHCTSRLRGIMAIS